MNHNVDDDLPLIAQGLHLDLEQLRATLRRYRAAPGYQPIPIKQDITADEQAFIEARRNELPELGNNRRGTPALSARRVCRAPDRLCGRGERGRPEQPAFRLLHAGRRGG
jgi:hypothetical protein